MDIELMRVLVSTTTPVAAPHIDTQRSGGLCAKGTKSAAHHHQKTTVDTAGLVFTNVELL